MGEGKEEEKIGGERLERVERAEREEMGRG